MNVMKTYFFNNNLLFKTALTSKVLVHTQINHKMSVGFKYWPHIARNLKGRHLVAVRMLVMLLCIEWVLQAKQLLDLP